MTLRDAVGVVETARGDSLVIAANGYISREVYARGDRPSNFYMIGSMGLASSIGLGLALALPGRRVFVYDGDGNILMNLGALAVVAACRPGNLVHVVFDNGVYSSTGNQRSVAESVDLAALAAAAGYPVVERATEAGGLAAAVARLSEAAGPVFLLVKVVPEPPGRRLPRVEPRPERIAGRFRAAAVS